MNTIIEGLFVGNASSAKHALNKFDLIVNCTKHIPDSIPDPFIQGKNGKFIRMPIDDTTDDNDLFLQLIPDIVQEIHHILSNNGTVLVHCQQGASRSPSVVAAYLIRYFNFNLDEVVQYIQSKRKVSFYGNIVNFRKALQIYQKTRPPNKIPN